MDKYDEIDQLQIAYDAIKTQPRDVQERMLAWLQDRTAADYRQAMQDRENAAKARIAVGKAAAHQETK